MTLQDIEVIIRKYPNSRHAAHIANGALVFDQWVCAEHPAVPTDAEVQAWREEHENSLEQKIARFNFKQMWGKVWAGFSVTAKVGLTPYKGTIEDLWHYPNRSDIYPFFQALVQAGKATEADLQVLVEAFSEQGIDITTIQ